MKHYRFIHMTLFTMAFLTLGSLLACGEDNINVGSNINEKDYGTSEQIVGYVTGNDGKQKITRVEFRDTKQIPLYLMLNKNATQETRVTFKYDPTVLDEYNAENGTDYALFPQPAVTFENGGLVTIAKGEKRSSHADISVVSDGTLDPEVSYVIPVSGTLSGDGIVLNNDAKFLIFAKDLSQIPSADKAGGLKIISCMEVNDTNPLNNLCFTLKSTGKPLVDVLILFSGNINYNAETGRVYNFNNENVQHLLDNREKYLKPLQDRGIKVLLGIMGNHDRAGVANLGDETAKALAQELRGVCEAYKLDGIFLDDEYTKDLNPVPAGFVRPSYEAASRLCYECKQAMPDKLITVYVYSRTYKLVSVDGVQPGDYLDMGIHDYGGSSDLSNNYPGLDKKGMYLYSQEFARGYTSSENSLKKIKDSGYGGNMIFAMDPFRGNFSYLQLPAMQQLANVFYGDELVYDGKPYKKDW